MPFQPGDKVVHDSDQDEILTVEKSGLYRTLVYTFDGVDISYATADLRKVELPVAV